MRAKRGVSPLEEKTLLPYLKEVEKYRPLTRDEEKELLTRAKKGEAAAREKLILSYQRLVLSIAKRYSRSSIPLSDLINEGNIALMEAIESFNPNKRLSFSVFARYRINYRLLSVLEQKGILKIPPMKKLLLKRMFYLLPKLTYCFGREVKKEELAAALRISPLELEELLILSEKPVISLNQDGRNPASPLEELLREASVPSPEEIFKRKELREEIERALNSLEDREKEVIQRYFGLLDDKPQTLQKIGEALGITRETVRQIKKRSLRKLRQKIRNRDLRLIFGFE